MDHTIMLPAKALARLEAFAQAFRPQREAPPQRWLAFCRELLGLSQRQSRRWWQALQQSTGARSVAMRTALLAAGCEWVSRDRLKHLMDQSVTPQSCIAVLEDLVEEGRLPPGDARAMEQAVLAKTAKEGTWKVSTEVYGDGTAKKGTG